MNLLDQLHELTRTLGRPEMDYVIIGEGNTSVRIDDESFYIKASGQQMRNIEREGFVAVRFAPVLAMLDNPSASLAEQKAIAQAACIEPAEGARPSVEVSFHAMLLAETGVRFVGHTHATAVNQIMCSPRAEDFALNRQFPDEAVLCGPESVFVPYADPGLPLAILMREKVRDYMQKQGEAPKVILLANHGLIALGESAEEILNITAMCVKAARIFVGAASLGGPVFMDRQEVAHIYHRPDEIYRRSLFVQKQNKDL